MNYEQEYNKIRSNIRDLIYSKFVELVSMTNRCDTIKTVKLTVLFPDELDRFKYMTLIREINELSKLR